MKKFTWLVSITVDETWVADGFDCSPEHLDQALGAMLPFATSDEMSAKVIKAPDDKKILKAQGYPV